MTTTSALPLSAPTRSAALERWFSTGLAVTMIVVTIAGFAPSVVNPSGRRAPISLLDAAHGIVASLWLVLFLVQTLMIATRHRALHRRLGFSSIALAAAMLPLGYATAIVMIRRGFDLSGDLHVGHDPIFEALFPLWDLLIFALFFTFAVIWRRRPLLHRRCILFATVTLMEPSLTHLLGHNPRLAALPPAIIMLPFGVFLAAVLVRDYLAIHRLSPGAWLIALAMLASGPLRAGVIGPSAAWHRLGTWLAQLPLP